MPAPVSRFAEPAERAPWRRRIMTCCTRGEERSCPRRDLERTRRLVLILRPVALIGGASLATLVAGWRSGAPSVAALPAAKRIKPGSLPPRRPSPNPYLRELRARRHRVTRCDCRSGSIPSELRGTLLRNGPNPIAPDPANYHWFLGDGMVHAIEAQHVTE